MQEVLTTIGLPKAQVSLLTSFLSVSFSTISEASQVKISLLDELEVEVIQEGLVEPTMIGL
jgi:hypothetical protein